MKRKHFEPHSARRSVKTEQDPDPGFLPTTEAWVLIKSRLERTKSLQPLGRSLIPGSMRCYTAGNLAADQDLPQMLAYMHSQWIEGRALEPSFETGPLRRCPVCNRIFLALRRDAPCCSLQCSHIRRQHRFTGNWEQYRRAREFRNRTGLAAVKGKERRRLMELYEALRAIKPEDDADQ